MAVKRTRAVKEKADSGVVLPISASDGKRRHRLSKWLILVLLVLAGLIIYWYRTNNWPVLAVVNFKPISRHEINKALFARGGVDMLENRITEIEVMMELEKLGIEITDEEVDQKINELKAGVGEDMDFEQMLLTYYGMTVEDLRYQTKLKIGIEKAVAGKLEVTDEEAVAYLESYGGTATDSAQMASAREMVKQTKIVSEMQVWLEELETKYKVWRAPGF